LAISETVFAAGRGNWKGVSGKCDTVKNAGMENAGVG